MTRASAPTAATAGYSGTPLTKKLGLTANSRMYTIGAPPDYAAWLGPLPPGATISARAPSTGCEFVHIFVRSMAELDRGLPSARRAITPAGAIWVSWPKKSSGIPSDVSENAIRDHALRTDLVDVKVCAVTEIWSGLKLVVRKHLR